MRTGLRRRLLFAFGFLGLLLLIVTSTALVTLQTLVRTGLQEALHQEDVSQLANDVAVSALMCRRYEKEFLLNVEAPLIRARSLEAWKESNTRLLQGIDAFAATTSDAEDLRQIELWRAAMSSFLDGFEQATRSIESGRLSGPYEAGRALEPVGFNLGTLTDLSLETAREKRRATQLARDRLEQLTGRFIVGLAGLGAAALLGAIGWSFVFSRRLLRPILALHTAATRLAEGELSARAEVVGGRAGDEIGELSIRFNRMAETIQQRSIELKEQYESAESARTEAEAARTRIAAQLETITQQKQLIGDLGVPILPLDGETLVVPLVGELDGDRMTQAEERVLTAIERAGARFLILDITAVPIVDTRVADGLIRLVRAVELLGAQAVLVGIRPDVAGSLVELGVDLGKITTERSLQSGVAHTASRARRRAARHGDGGLAARGGDGRR